MINLCSSGGKSSQEMTEDEVFYKEASDLHLERVFLYKRGFWIPTCHMYSEKQNCYVNSIQLF